MNTDYSYCSGVTCSIRKSCKRYLPDPPDTRLQWVWPAYNPGTDKCKALETEIDGEIERVNSITGVSSVSKEPRQTNLFTD